jgi:hypothetical protein
MTVAKVNGRGACRRKSHDSREGRGGTGLGQVYLGHQRAQLSPLVGLIVGAVEVHPRTAPCVLAIAEEGETTCSIRLVDGFVYGAFTSRAAALQFARMRGLKLSEPGVRQPEPPAAAAAETAG